MELGVHFEGYVYDAVGVLAVLVLCVCGAGNRGLNRVFFYKKKGVGLPHPNRLDDPRLARGAGTKFRGFLRGLPRGVVLRTLKAIASDNIHRHNWCSPFLIL